jgi:hypothetical protein
MTSPRPIWALAALLCLVAWLWSPSLRAGRALVVVLRPANASGAVLEAATRTEAELAAAGFDVLVRELAAADARAALEQAAAAHDAAAAIAVLPAAGATAADLWVADRVTGKTLVRQVRVDELPPHERPRALAIRAVDLLRASLIETTAEATAHQPHRPLPRDMRRWLGEERRPAAESAPVAFQGLHAELAVALLTSVDSLGPAGAPQLRLGWGSDFGLGTRLSFSGPAFGARPEGRLGSAGVRQLLGTFDLLYAPPVDWAGLVPVLWLGGGVYHLYAEGDVAPPLVSRSDQVLAAAGVAGLGLGYRLHPKVTALLDLAALLTAPRAVVTILGEPIGSAGRPSLLGSLGVAMAF